MIENKNLIKLLGILLSIFIIATMYFALCTRIPWSKAVYLSDEDIFKTIQICPPEKGILGGTMQWMPSTFEKISDHWVYARFEDGHISGHAILKYQMVEDHIYWKVIDYHMD